MIDVYVREYAEQQAAADGVTVAQFIGSLFTGKAVAA